MMELNISLRSSGVQYYLFQRYIYSHFPLLRREDYSSTLYVFMKYIMIGLVILVDEPDDEHDCECYHGDRLTSVA